MTKKITKKIILSDNGIKLNNFESGYIFALLSENKEEHPDRYKLKEMSEMFEKFQKSWNDVYEKDYQETVKKWKIEERKNRFPPD